MSKHINNIVIEKPSSSLRQLVPSASWHFQPRGVGGVFVDGSVFCVYRCSHLIFITVLQPCYGEILPFSASTIQCGSTGLYQDNRRTWPWFFCGVVGF